MRRPRHDPSSTSRRSRKSEFCGDKPIATIVHGIQAATKRKAEANGGNYEPTLAATTKNLGDSIEIRIRDNGTGIPPEV
jgi:signal transduction histidine kinase